MKQNRTQDGPKSKTKTKMKKEALEDHLGAVLERSWLDFGSSWVPPEGQNRAVAHTALVFLKIDVFEKKWS